MNDHGSERHHLHVAYTIQIGYFSLMHSAWHAEKVHMEVTCNALWGKGVELAIIIIVCFDV
jgi:hypothetical protein